MDIRHNRQTGQGAFLAVEDGRTVGELTYVFYIKGKTIRIDHTRVHPSQRGKGLAHRLIEAAVAYARAEGLSIVPVCSFAVAEFKRHPEYEDVRDQSADAADDATNASCPLRQWE